MAEGGQPRYLLHCAPFFVYQAPPVTDSAFSTLPLSLAMVANLDSLGYTGMTPIQAKSLPVILEGADLIAQAKTGSGKTAAFGIGLLNPLNPRYFGCQALVLCPTRELADQVAKEIRRLARGEDNIKVLTLCGGVPTGPQRASLEHGAQIIVGTPGRVQEHLSRETLNLDGLNTLVLDEADRMLDMGFSEDVITIANACPAERQTLLFSATKGSAGLQRIAESVLREPQWLELDSIRDGTPAIHQQVIPTDDSNHKEATLKWLLTHESPGKALVFTNTRDMADRLNGVLRAADLRVFVLHGEKDQKIRKLAIERFKQSQRAVLVATDVAARGLDIDALDLVINFDMPRSGDDYLHRVGRTGRAGAEGIAISLVAPHEWNLMSSIERYLRRQFERRILKEVPGSFKGPKKVKASGKPVGSKKPKESKKVKEGKKKKAESKRPESGKAGTPRPASTARPKTSADGMSTFKRPG